MPSAANLDFCQSGISYLKSCSNKSLIFHTGKSHLDFVFGLSVADRDNLLFKCANVYVHRLGKVCGVCDDCRNRSVWRGLIISIALVRSNIETFFRTCCTSPFLIIEGAANASSGCLLKHGQRKWKVISFLWAIAYFSKFIAFQGSALQVKVAYLTINFGVMMLTKLGRQASWVVEHTIEIGGAWAIDSI